MNDAEFLDHCVEFISQRQTLKASLKDTVQIILQMAQEHQEHWKQKAIKDFQEKFEMDLENISKKLCS